MALILGILPTLVDRLPFTCCRFIVVGSRLPGTHILELLVRIETAACFSLSCSFMCGFLLIIAGMVAVPQHSSLLHQVAH